MPDFMSHTKLFPKAHKERLYFMLNQILFKVNSVYIYSIAYYSHYIA